MQPKFQRQIRGFRPRQAERNSRRAIATAENGKQTFWAPVLLFAVVRRRRNHLATLLSSLSW